MASLEEATGSTDTSLQENPFCLLGATTRDPAQRVIELADERSLTLDDDLCRKARSDLTTPKLRVAAEVAWLLGVSPGEAEQLVSALRHRPLRVADDQGLPTLVRVNLMAAALQCEGQGERNDFALLAPSDAARFILTFSHLIEITLPEDVLRDINEDRAVSGFPEIRGTEQIEVELADLRRRYRTFAKGALNRMSPAALVETMAIAARVDTDRGDRQASTFLDELVDVYQDETKPFLDDEKAKMGKLLETASGAAAMGAAALAPVISKLEEVAANWVKVAEPIQLSLKARGIEHDMSHQIAYGIRGLGIKLFNEYGMLEEAQRITALLQKLFAYVPDVAARIHEDADAIRGIDEARKKAVQDQAEWAEAITYQTDVGAVFKTKLAISPGGVEWRGSLYPLPSINRVRWGGVNHSINGIPTGTTYTIGFGDDRSEAEISFRDSNKYRTFLDCLWKAVCVRLMGDILISLRDGQHLAFGDAVVTDTGVTLTKHKFLGNEKVFCGWSQIKIWSANGSFCMASQSDAKTYSRISYIHTPNAHLLDHLIRLSFKTPGTTLSRLLTQN